jgi:hypothetical protein
MKNIKRRMTPQPLKIRADVELTCFHYDGIEHIKKAMRAAEATSTEDCQVGPQGVLAGLAGSAAGAAGSMLSCVHGHGCHETLVALCARCAAQVACSALQCTWPCLAARAVLPWHLPGAALGTCLTPSCPGPLLPWPLA